MPVVKRFHPFTPKNDWSISNLPCSLTRNITSHSLWRTWPFIAYSDEGWSYYQFSLPHLYYISLLKGWENVLGSLHSLHTRRNSPNRSNKKDGVKTSLSRHAWSRHLGEREVQLKTVTNARMSVEVTSLLAPEPEENRDISEFELRFETKTSKETKQLVDGERLASFVAGRGGERERERGGVRLFQKIWKSENQNHRTLEPECSSDIKPRGWGGGGTPIWKGPGCSSGIFVLTPKRH